MRDLNKQGLENEARADVNKITDGLGMPIDEGIKETVVAFRVSGFPTTGSCEGHLNRGTSYPWVDIDVSELENFKKINSAKDKASVWRKVNMVLRKKMRGYLYDFYKNRASSSKLELKLVSIGIFGAFRIQSPSKLLNNTKSSEELLLQYRKEMNDFASYLLSRLK